MKEPHTQLNINYYDGETCKRDVCTYHDEAQHGV